MTLPAYPSRLLTSDEIQRYEDEGVIMVKGLLDKNWLSLIEHGIEEALQNTSITGKFMSRKTKGYQMDIYLWKRIDALRDLIYYSPFSRWAQALMRTEEVRFFYDQMFVKEPGVDAPTPWHQDLSFWPIQGNQICSFWVPLDPVNKECSGLQYVKGSHKWTNTYRAITPDYNATMLDSDLEEVPDINANPEHYDIVDWDMEPGDVLIFHPLTLHGSSGNKSRKQKRRALALRWLGDDVKYVPGKATMPISYQHTSQVNGSVSGAAFPKILPNHISEERVHRSRGPESMLASVTVQSLFSNALASMKLLLSGHKKDSLKQTW